MNPAKAYNAAMHHRSHRMSLRRRILSVFRGETPDVVPFMLDLSHWLPHKLRLPFDLSRSYEEPIRELVEYHKRNGVGFYLSSLTGFCSVEYSNDVTAETIRETSGGKTRIRWKFATSLGEIERVRTWDEQTYSWHVTKWGVESQEDLRVLTHALSARRFGFKREVYRAWRDAVGDTGVVYVGAGYSAIGHLMNYWMGVERAILASVDWPDVFAETVERINANTLELVNALVESPAEVIVMGDNISSDIQPPRFFAKWSAPFYTEAARRLHTAGKHLMIHIDGRLRGALRMVRETSADGGDAITPTPLGDLTPEQCREEAGPDFLLSGGVSPELWLPNAALGDFEDAVLRWLALRRCSPRLIAAAGDQVPPGADEDRIGVMRDLVERHGRY